MRVRHRVSHELERLAGIATHDVTVGADVYATSGLSLSWPERRAAGLALLERDRASGYTGATAIVGGERGVDRCGVAADRAA